MHGNFFPTNIAHFQSNSHRFVAKSVHKCHKSTRHSKSSILLAVETCALVFSYISHTMIGRHITNHSFKKKEAPWFDLFSQKLSFLFFALKMDTFVSKAK